MSVGLYDSDIARYGPLVFNLELMKLSTYWKRKNELVSLARAFTPEKHCSFYYWKDWNDGIFPKGLDKSNVTYGGLAFTNGIHQQLDGDVELLKPDVSLYTAAAPIFSRNKTTRSFYEAQMQAAHCRLSQDGATIWKNFFDSIPDLSKKSLLIFHDANLAAIPGAIDFIQTELPKKPRFYIGLKFPIEISNAKDLIQWSKLKTNLNFYQCNYNGMMDTLDWYKFWYGNYRRKVYDNFYYYPFSGMETEEIESSGIRTLFHQIIISRTIEPKILLKYNTLNFTSDYWKLFFELIQLFMTSKERLTAEERMRYCADDTFHSYIKSILKKEYTPRCLDFFIERNYSGRDISYKVPLAEMYEFIRSKNKELFDDLYNCSYNSLLEEFNGRI